MEGLVFIRPGGNEGECSSRFVLAWRLFDATFRTSKTWVPGGNGFRKGKPSSVGLAGHGERKALCNKKP